MLTLSFIYFGVLINSIFGVFSLLDILDFLPARPEKKDEYKLAGFLYPILGAMSLVILKYGSWSMAAGIKTYTFSLPKMWGNVFEKAGTAYTAGKAYLPILSD